jgi:hypothetical protein
MMILALILAGVAFYEVFVGIDAVRHLQGMSEAGRSSLAVMRDPQMNDDEKAAAMRRASGAMFSNTALMLAKTLLAVAAAGVVLWLAALLVPAWTLEALLVYGLTWIGIAGVIVALLLYGKLRHGRG